MHYVYIVCFWLVISWTVCVAIPPWTVNWMEYLRKYDKVGNMSGTIFIFNMLPCLVIGFKLAVIFVNYLGW